MDAILAPERDMKGSLEVGGYRMVDVVSKASVLAKDNFEGNLLEVYFICICVDKKTRCVFVHCIHVHESVGRCDLSFCQEVFCSGIGSAYC